ncbi:MAG: ABC transporter permease [Proteobacteria bacterium]|nr:ABC transporter permease [Pseudomonadota bacterium]
MKKILALVHTRNLEFVRDKEGMTWNLFVPLFLLFALNLIFSGANKALFNIGILGESQSKVVNEQALLSLPNVKYHYFTDEAKAKKQLEQHQIELLLNNQEGQESYWVNKNSDKSQFLGHIIEQHYPKLKQQESTGVALRYVDWVLPGVLAINMMYSCLYGIGYGIIRYRRMGYLKRLHTTPLKAIEFLSAQVISRLLITQIVVTVIFVGCWLLFSPRIEGSILQLLCLSVLGALSLISVALLISARGQSEELSRGLLEMAAWPMLMLSGAFFTLDEAHPMLKMLANFLPLTHIVSSARDILLYGATWAELASRYLILGLMTVVLLVSASMLFCWQSNS